jgi:oxalate decarboxylase/phosphoglucose isomerase-like protein (cupin superfamily)
MTIGQLIDMLEDKSGGAEVTVVTPKGELEVIDVREDKIGYVTIVCGEEVG